MTPNTTFTVPDFPSDPERDSRAHQLANQLADRMETLIRARAAVRHFGVEVERILLEIDALDDETSETVLKT